jgi:uncharacterized membrane protein YhdT
MLTARPAQILAPDLALLVILDISCLRELVLLAKLIALHAQVQLFAQQLHLDISCLLVPLLLVSLIAQLAQLILSQDAQLLRLVIS